MRTTAVDTGWGEGSHLEELTGKKFLKLGLHLEKIRSKNSCDFYTKIHYLEIVGIWNGFNIIHKIALWKWFNGKQAKESIAQHDLSLF